MSPILLTAVVVGALLLVWLFFTERHDLALVALLLYLGLLDGYLKLRTDSSTVTLVRDALLYAIVLGVVGRRVLRRQPLVLPPLSGWVLLYTGVVAVQVLNPGNASIGHALASLRPHLEFVPLFFLGYAELRSAKRLRVLCVLLVLVAAANGVVGYVQFRLTPAQLAAWGPGYAARVYGTGPVSGRTFTDSSGVVHTRPFGLGADAGDGGLVGMLALAPALALIGLGRRVAARRLVLLLMAGVLLAIVTSQGRADVLASVAAVLAFLAMASAARRLVPSLVSMAAGGLMLFLVLSTLAGAAPSGLFDRYRTISPASLTATASSSRGSSLDLLPGYVTRFPLGAGLGSTGPAALIAGAAHTGLDGETEFNFLIVELGLAGLVLFVAFNARLMLRALTRIRTVPDPEARILLAGLAAGLFGIAATYFAGPSSSASPVAPFFWLTAGVLSYWLWEVRA
ncbi:MAG: hypothetical protein ACHQDY_00885 [Solirubrobacterales bacterium]